MNEMTLSRENSCGFSLARSRESRSRASMKATNAKSAMEVARKSALKVLAELNKKIAAKHKHVENADWAHAGDVLHYLQQLEQLNSEIS